MMKIEHQTALKVERARDSGAWIPPGIEPIGPSFVVGRDNQTTLADFFAYADAIGATVLSRSFTIEPAERPFEPFTFTHAFGVVPSLAYISCGRDEDDLSAGDEEWTAWTISLRTSADHKIVVRVVGMRSSGSSGATGSRKPDTAGVWAGSCNRPW